jgi:enoyl-CoA hydratase/carnithine racemase
VSECVRVQRDPHVTVVTLHRPERRNAMHDTAWRTLREVAEALADDPPRTLVVTGAGGHFSSGMDLAPDNPLVRRLLPLIQGRDEDGLHQLIAELQATMNAYADFPVPVIAAVEGACIGGGLEWALACDLIVASETASFAMPETRYGMIPDVGGSTRLTRRLGRSRAADMILTGRTVTIDEAERWGLVDRRVPAGEALTRARELAREICQGSPTATREALTVLEDLEHNEPSFAREQTAGCRALLSGEVFEGIAAFGARRKPEWAP